MVQEHSTSIDGFNVKTSTILANHMDMCKFDDARDINTFPVALLLLLDERLKKLRKVTGLLGLKPLLLKHQPFISLLLPSPVNPRILELMPSARRVLVIRSKLRKRKTFEGVFESAVTKHGRPVLRRFRFLHKTIKEFITRPENRNILLPAGLQPTFDANIHLLSTCLSQLKL